MTPDIPPIVLLVDRNPETLAVYSHSFEDAGLWVATIRASTETVAYAEELHPDVIIADLEALPPPALEVIETLKRHSDLRDIPIVALVPQSAPVPPVADVTLRKPVPKEVLLRRIHEVLARSNDLRHRSNDIVKRCHALADRSQLVVNAAAEITERVQSMRRLCPTCSHSLEWVERGTIEAVTYDYYRRCIKGCGLFCYNVDTRRWVRLA